jgi:hypothetical protein
MNAFQEEEWHMCVCVDGQSSGQKVRCTRQASPRGCSAHPSEFSQAHAPNSCSQHHLIPTVSTNTILAARFARIYIAFKLHDKFGALGK